MSREKTSDEVRIELLKHIKVMVEYWDAIPNITSKEKLDGLAFSILNTLDGGTHLPSFIVAPIPHHEDKQFHINEESNYYPENHEIEDKIKCDIGGSLHEHYGRV